MTTIYAATNDQVLVATILPKIARNNINMVRLYVAFDSTWDDTVKSAVFYTSKNPLPYEVILSDGYCLVPQEVLAEEAKLYITVKGVLSTGAVKTSTVLSVKVLDGTPTVIISDPAPSVYQQLVSEAAVLKARMNLFTALAEGSTTGDAELTDIRVGANGITYATAGEATRALWRKLQGVMQTGGEENPLRPLMFDQHLSYKGGTPYKYENLSIPSYKLGNIDHYNSIEKTDGANYVIGGKLASPIPTTEETDGKYYVIVESNADFNAYVIVSSQGNWGTSAKRLHSKSFNVRKGYNIIPLTLEDATNEGVTADYYNYVMFRSSNPFEAEFTAYIVHGGGVLGWILDKHPTIEEYITCWGDSLTAQAGWTAKLEELSGMTVHNAGTGGENVRTITARQGADPIIVNDITIPAGVEPVTIATYAQPFTTALGYNATPLLQGGAHVNPVKIGDIEGTLKWTGSSYNDTTGTWTFTRSVAGEETVINRPTALTTAFDREKNSPYLMIIFMGQNGGYGADNDELVNLHRLMINHAKAKHTIVLGLSSGSEASRASYEKAMKKAFGRYFISLREYLSKYGLDDAGLTATANDLAAMETGTVPPQLLADSVHFTSATKTVIGNLIYKRCRELGIFE